MAGRTEDLLQWVADVTHTDTIRAAGEAWNRREMQRAVQLFTEAYRNGAAGAAYCLGVVYHDASPQEALRFYGEALEAGDSRAEMPAADLRFRLYPTDQSRADFVRLLAQAALAQQGRRAAYARRTFNFGIFFCFRSTLPP